MGPSPSLGDFPEMLKKPKSCISDPFEWNLPPDSSHLLSPANLTTIENTSTEMNFDSPLRLNSSFPDQQDVSPVSISSDEKPGTIDDLSPLRLTKEPSVQRELKKQKISHPSRPSLSLSSGSRSGSQKRKRHELNDNFPVPENGTDFLTELRKQLEDLRLSNEDYKSINGNHRELLSQNKLVSCQKFTGRLFSTEEEKIFSEPVWYAMGGSIQTIIDCVGGLEVKDNMIYDSYARRAQAWHTPETDEALPFRKNCRWSQG